MQRKKTEDDRIKMTQMSVIQNNSKLNFNNDVEFLLYMINFKIKNTQNETLEAAKSSGARMPASEELFQSCIQSVIYDVMFCLSEEYKIVLYRYFNEEGLITFVTQNVVNEFLKISLTMNLKTNRINILEKPEKK